MLEQTSTLVTIASCLVAILAAVLGWLRWVRPRLHTAISRTGAALDTIAGRDAIVDNITGEVYSEALPSMGVRLASVESAVALLAKQHQRLDDHERRIKRLEVAKPDPELG